MFSNSQNPLALIHAQLHIKQSHMNTLVFFDLPSSLSGAAQQREKATLLIDAHQGPHSVRFYKQSESTHPSSVLQVGKLVARTTYTTKCRRQTLNKKTDAPTWSWWLRAIQLVGEVRTIGPAIALQRGFVQARRSVSTLKALANRRCCCWRRRRRFCFGCSSPTDPYMHAMFCSVCLLLKEVLISFNDGGQTNKQATPTLNNDNVKVLFLAGHMRSFLTGFLLSCEWPEIKETYSKRVA